MESTILIDEVPPWLRASAPPLAAFSRRPGAHGTSFHGLSGRFTRVLASYLSEKQW